MSDAHRADCCRVSRPMRLVCLQDCCNYCYIRSDGSCDACDLPEKFFSCELPACAIDSFRIIRSVDPHQFKAISKRQAKRYREILLADRERYATHLQKALDYYHQLDAPAKAKKSAQVKKRRHEKTRETREYIAALKARIAELEGTHDVWI